MNYPRFLAFSIGGVVGWIFCISTLGYTLGSVPLVRAHFEKVIALIIVLSLIPVMLEALKARRGASKGRASAEPEPEA